MSIDVHIPPSPLVLLDVRLEVDPILSVVEVTNYVYFLSTASEACEEACENLEQV